MNLGHAFRNDFIFLEARLALMREQQTIKCCPKCMQEGMERPVCPTCRPQSSFPSAFSSQAEWDSEEEGSISVPLLTSQISLFGKHGSRGGQ